MAALHTLLEEGLKLLPEDQQEPIRNEKIVWVDISQCLEDASEELEVGEMVRTENFSLLEAMSAIELMDPKMDAGMSSVRILSVDERVEAGILKPSSALTIQQKLYLLDNMCMGEMSWYQGQSLAQTVFTCMYLLPSKVDLLDCPYMFSCGKALLKTVHGVRKSILKGDIYEEEDFAGHPFSFLYAEELTEQDLLGYLTAAEQSAMELLECAKRGKWEHLTPLQADASKEVQYCEALLCRIRFRRAWYTLHRFLRMNSDEKKISDSTMKTLKYAKTHFQNMVQTAHLATCEPFGFDEEVNRHMLGATPCRSIQLMTVTEAFDAIRENLDHLEVLAATRVQNINQTEEFFEEFSARLPGILPRTYLRLWLLSEKIFTEGVTLESCLLDSMQNMGVIWPSSLEEGRKASFVRDLVNSVAETLKTYCHNRPRERRRLANLMDRWGAFQGIATDVDSVLLGSYGDIGEVPLGPLNTWIHDFVLRHMIRFLRLGCELEILAAHEYPFVFYYMEYLVELRLKNWQHMKVFEIPDETSLLSAKEKRKQRKRKSSGSGQRLDEFIAPAGRDMQIALLNMARGLQILCTMLRDLGVTAPPQAVSGNEEYRYCHRMFCFRMLLHPPVIPYGTYQVESNYEKDGMVKLMHSAIGFFKGCKEIVESILKSDKAREEVSGRGVLSTYTKAKLKGLMKAAIGNNVSVAMLVRPLADDEKDHTKLEELFKGKTATFEWESVGNLFPVIKFVDTKPKDQK